MGYDINPEDLNWLETSVHEECEYDLEEAVSELVSKLPEEVQTFVMCDVYWFSTPEWAYAVAFPFSLPVFHMPEDNRATCRIILLSSNIYRIPRERAMFTIAHEIAHSWLGHGVVTKEENDEQEAAADALAAEWGFPRPEEEQE